MVTYTVIGSKKLVRYGFGLQPMLAKMCVSWPGKRNRLMSLHCTGSDSLTRVWLEPRPAQVPGQETHVWLNLFLSRTSPLSSNYHWYTRRSAILGSAHGGLHWFHTMLTRFSNVTLGTAKPIQHYLVLQSKLISSVRGTQGVNKSKAELKDLFQIHLIIGSCTKYLYLFI